MVLFYPTEIHMYPVYVESSSLVLINSWFLHHVRPTSMGRRVLRKWSSMTWMPGGTQSSVHLQIPYQTMVSGGFSKKSGENLWNFQRRTTWTCNSSDVTLGCSCIYVAVYLISLIPNIKCLKLRKKHQKTACLSRGKMISYWIWGYPDLKRTRASCTVAASLW